MVATVDRAGEVRNRAEVNACKVDVGYEHEAALRVLAELVEVGGCSDFIVHILYRYLITLGVALDIGVACSRYSDSRCAGTNKFHLSSADGSYGCIA